MFLEITDLARGGSGVARNADGQVFFVPLTMPGDQVEANLIESHKTYSEAALVAVQTPSPQRLEPQCAVFGKCGGCSWQHIPYETQWNTKKNGVKHALKRVQIDGSQLGWAEYPAQNAWSYRNRVQLRGFKSQMGFYARGTNILVPVDHCSIARAEINSVLEEARQEGSSLNQPYKVEIEILADGSVRKTWNAGHSAAGFRQVNDVQNELLKSWIADKLTNEKPLLDLFGGGGNLSLELAAKMKSVVCVDTSAPSAAPEGTPENYQFIRSAVLPWVLRERKKGIPVTTHLSAIIDPPREGLAETGPELIRGLNTLGVDEVVLVGCDPDSWARDLSRFQRQKWTIQECAVFDFFPQTPHVEAAAVLRKNLS